MYKDLKYIKILFLEDNIEFAQNTIKLLHLYVDNIIHVTNMKEALKSFENEHIDMIISDLKVEDGIALGFIEKVRQTDTTIPIVVLSAHKDESFLFKAIPLGLTYYAIKPIDFNEFELILKKCSDIFKKNKKDLYYLKDEKYYNKNKKIITDGDTQIALSKKEALFIELLLENKDGIIKKDKIDDILWANEIMTESALKNFFLRVRKKLGKEFFYTIQNVGYRL
jgi:DNA-binding response OmpR family regulator